MNKFLVVAFDGDGNNRDFIVNGHSARDAYLSWVTYHLRENELTDLSEMFDPKMLVRVFEITPGGAYGVQPWPDPISFTLSGSAVLT